MQTASIRELQPRLQSVFGPLTAEEDADIRRILHATDDKLLALARHFGLQHAGSEGTGLDFFWYPSGQTGISSSVGPSDGHGHCVSFEVSLEPAWSHGQFPAEPAWDVAIEIYADCQHSKDHGGMDLVYDSQTRVTSPLKAAAALFSAVEELGRRAEQTPLEEWLRMASDDFDQK